MEIGSILCHCLIHSEAVGVLFYEDCLRNLRAVLPETETTTPLIHQRVVGLFEKGWVTNDVFVIIILIFHHPCEPHRPLQLLG